MISASRRISRILWEGTGSGELRERLHVANDSPLRQANKVRNAMEHIETRLPEFVRAHPGKHMAGWTLSNDPTDSTRPDSVRLRYLNVTSWKCGAYDIVDYKECNLETIATAARALKFLLHLTLHTTIHFPQRVPSDPTSGET